MLLGQMMGSQLTITSIMNFADRVYPKSQIVSLTGSEGTHRYTCGWRMSNSTADSGGHVIGRVRPHPKVRFQKPVTRLQLTATQLGIVANQSRHRLGLGLSIPGNFVSSALQIRQIQLSKFFR